MTNVPFSCILFFLKIRARQLRGDHSVAVRTGDCGSPSTGSTPVGHPRVDVLFKKDPVVQWIEQEFSKL